MREQSEEWFRKSESDYELAEDNFEIGHVEASMFFCHQAIEKALKALLIERTGEKPFSHNLVTLSNDIDLEEGFPEIFADLNPFYTGFRYPDEDSPSIENPKEVLEKAGDFLEWTEKRLEE